MLSPRYLLISPLLLQPSLVLAHPCVTFVNSPSNSSLRRVCRHEQSCQKYQASSNDVDSFGEIIHVLRKYGFGNRIVTLTNTDLSQNPMLAEIYAESRMNLCLLHRWVPTSAALCIEDDKPPLLEVLVLGDDGLFKDTKVIDIGQITTLWQKFDSLSSFSTLDELENRLTSIFERAQESLQNNILPVEIAMQNIYNGRMANRSLPSSNNRPVLTKKQIPQTVSQIKNSAHAEELLRNLVKMGDNRTSRLVDSTIAADYLYSDYCRDGDDEQIIRRLVSAKLLTEDAASGGRFKRRPCLFVAAQLLTSYGGTEDMQVSIINGGWIAVDPSAKAAAEGRKFAMTSNDINESSNPKKGPLVFTVADERIAHRLECLAMGDAWKNESDSDKDKKLLEVDVREALTRMNLPLTSQGATEALVKIGRWTMSANDEETKKSKAFFEPWSPELLDAARSLALSENRRRESFAKICYPSDGKGSTKSSSIEGRTDLTKLPCICVDAQRTSFRDDSIGIRLRSSTGRKVHKLASKWEVMIHIADVSDIYFDGDMDPKTRLLRQAAERRGQSRYDLPLGPLHLLPPVALAALSLASNKEESPNRCVTLWAYIDERDGKLLEAGLERTLISSPKALSFAEATELLASDGSQSLSNINSILSVAERNLMLWSKHHQERNQAAQKREQRLSTKQLISNQMNTLPGGKQRDDGVGYSFQRSRGHRIVDSSLDLYAFALSLLMNRAKQPIPRALGRGADRGGRLGTAPLRRYIDGIAQRQAISVLCGYGKPLTKEECRDASKRAALASDNIDNIRSSKQSNDSGRDRRQVSALHNLSRHLTSITGNKRQQRMRATSTGRNNEVVILGVGAIGLCKGVKGMLKSGEQVLVKVDKIDPEMGLLHVSLV